MVFQHHVDTLFLKTTLKCSGSKPFIGVGSPESSDSLIKCVTVCGILMLTVVTSRDELPFTETVSLSELPDRHSSEVATAILENTKELGLP